jgi:hypothetical protein
MKFASAMPTNREGTFSQGECSASVLLRRWSHGHQSMLFTLDDADIETNASGKFVKKLQLIADELLWLNHPLVLLRAFEVVMLVPY